MLALLDRPTVGDSACAVKAGMAVVEAGWARYSLYGQSGHAYGFPQLELRFGLPDENELVLLPPNINRQTTPAGSLTGASASVVGLKHEFGYTSQWIFAGETLITLPSGSPDFGSAATGYAINGVIGYSPTPTIGYSLMLGVTHLTASANFQHGAYYWSINPDLVMTWLAAARLQFYGEIYGQTHTAPGQGQGYNADGGLQYLVNQNFEVDAEIGKRLTGNLAGWSNYYGIGFGLQF
ncbi:MAG: transporter [Gammaproteobacteria bacterium]|nr:transporter [Gammaproteobacteria bacterium]